MGLASFFRALPPCIGIYDPAKEEDDCEVCHTSKFQEIDFDGKGITKEEGMLKVSCFLLHVPTSTTISG